MLIALLRHSWRWMILLGPRSVDQRQGLLCLIAKVEPYDLGTGTPNFKGPRVSDHGRLVLAKLSKMGHNKNHKSMIVDHNEI
jgi:hypothetical protein